MSPRIFRKEIVFLRAPYATCTWHCLPAVATYQNPSGLNSSVYMNKRSHVLNSDSGNKVTIKRVIHAQRIHTKHTPFPMLVTVFLCLVWPVLLESGAERARLEKIRLLLFGHCEQKTERYYHLE